MAMIREQHKRTHTVRECGPVMRCMHQIACVLCIVYDNLHLYARARASRSLTMSEWQQIYIVTAATRLFYIDNQRTSINTSTISVQATNERCVQFFHGPWPSWNTRKKNFIETSRWIRCSLQSPNTE